MEPALAVLLEAELRFADSCSYDGQHFLHQGAADQPTDDAAAAEDACASRGFADARQASCEEGSLYRARHLSREGAQQGARDRAGDVFVASLAASLAIASSDEFRTRIERVIAKKRAKETDRD